MTETWTIPCVEPVIDAEELESLFTDLANNKLPTLQWRNPGRSSISVGFRNSPNMQCLSTLLFQESVTPENSSVQTQPATTPTRSNANDSYDFFDESPTSDVRIRKPVTPKSSAKKKTANFDNVLESFKKQGRMPLPKDPSAS